MSDEQWPKYYTTNTPGGRIAFVKRTSETAYTVVFKDGTEEPITCRPWGAMAMLDLRSQPQPQADVINVISFDQKTGEYSRGPYFEPGQLQPIETAPKDGTYILLFGPSGYTSTPLRCEVCRYDAEYRPLQPWVTYSDDSFLDSGPPPTHWMPLPSVPT